jgi:hypothetical protein
VQNDVITSADFVVESGQDSQIFILGEGPALIDYLSGGVLTSSPPDVVLMFANPYSSAGYYGTATYTLVSSTPEPSAFTLTLFALALVLIYRSARRAICNSCARKALLADRGTNV